MKITATEVRTFEVPLALQDDVRALMQHELANREELEEILGDLESRGNLLSITTVRLELVERPS